MAGSLNKVMIIGNVGRDAELRYTAGGTPTTSFSVAANRRWVGQDGQTHDDTEWFNIVTWTKLAERCAEMVTKGRKVYVEGRLQTRSWEKDGVKHYRTEVNAYTVMFLDSRPTAGQGMPESGFPDDNSVEADDIPF